MSVYVVLGDIILFNAEVCSSYSLLFQSCFTLASQKPLQPQFVASWRSSGKPAVNQQKAQTVQNTVRYEGNIVEVEVIT